MSMTEIIRIKEEILKFLKDQEAGVFLFGSRSRKDHHQGSDIDIGIIPRGPINKDRLILLRELLENLNTPYKIEIVDFSTVSEAFQKEALKDAEWWRD